MPVFTSTAPASVAETTQDGNSSNQEPPAEARVEFPPVTYDHIRHCSYDEWYPRYRSVTVRSRMLYLDQAVIDYLLADRIILADDEDDWTKAGTGDETVEDDEWTPSFVSSAGSGRPPATEDAESGSDDEGEGEAPIPPNRLFPEFHARLKRTLAELPGGAAAPKLNWSAPRDAAWIGRHGHSMRCSTPNDVYLLLKSSAFVSHDLERAFEGCVGRPLPAQEKQPQQQQAQQSQSRPLFRPVLVLRQWLPDLHPSLEFRCFVRHRRLVAISQRDNGTHYPFLDNEAFRAAIVRNVLQFFKSTLRETFPDGSFVFDVYFPEKKEEEEEDGDDNDYLKYHDDGDDEEEEERGEEKEDGGRRKRDPLPPPQLVDINPWAPRTDALLFDWAELLALPTKGPVLGVVEGLDTTNGDGGISSEDITSESETDVDEEDEDMPELRLVDKNNPAVGTGGACNFSAYKLPRDVVDASQAGVEGMRDFLARWRRFEASGRAD